MEFAGSYRSNSLHNNVLQLRQRSHPSGKRSHFEKSQSCNTVNPLGSYVAKINRRNARPDRINIGHTTRPPMVFG